MSWVKNQTNRFQEQRYNIVFSEGSGGEAPPTLLGWRAPNIRQTIMEAYLEKNLTKIIVVAEIQKIAQKFKNIVAEIQQ